MFDDLPDQTTLLQIASQNTSLLNISKLNGKIKNKACLIANEIFERYCKIDTLFKVQLIQFYEESE